ncbi:hypothetical protein OTU49_014911 [Cherax quadricarinatus]|uniref:Sulfatase N-terminal domain-containing protein n=1 Tax=Cherax quadricarinatus TaxID=27406 RepID=A0AAW0YFJ7_CHEQU
MLHYCSWNDVSWHNHQVKTPQLEALARSGVLLEQSYVQPICTPTRSALLAGRYPFTLGRQHDVLWPEEPTGLDLNVTLLPQSLKETGYSTHVVGKWHLGYCSWAYTPTERGFDTFYGYYTGAEDYYTHVRQPNTLRQDDFWTQWNDEESTRLGYDFRNNTKPDLSVDGIYSTYLFASYVEKLLSSRDPEEPMFLYLPFQSVHSPNEVPQNYTQPYSHIQDEHRRVKLGMVSALDEAVGRVVAALKSTHHYNNSIIVFTTDNGGPTVTSGNNWPLRGNKSTIWEGGTRGAAFVHSPLLPNPGTVSYQLMHVTDWYETLVGVAGGRAPQTDGMDQWATITGSAPSPRTHMIYNIDNTTSFVAGARIGDYKLLVGDPGPGEWTPPPENFTINSHFAHAIKNIASNENKLTVKLSGVSEPQLHVSQPNTALHNYNILDQSGPRQASVESENYDQLGVLQSGVGSDKSTELFDNQGPFLSDDLQSDSSAQYQQKMTVVEPLSQPSRVLSAKKSNVGPFLVRIVGPEAVGSYNVNERYWTSDKKEKSKILNKAKFNVKYFGNVDGNGSGSRPSDQRASQDDTQERWEESRPSDQRTSQEDDTQEMWEESRPSDQRTSLGDDAQERREESRPSDQRTLEQRDDTQEKEEDSQPTLQQLLQLFNTNITQIRLYNITADPEERVNLAAEEQGVVRHILQFILQQMTRYVPADIKPDDPAADPSNYNNIWSPGWCDPV